MNIIADENMPNAEALFSHLGQVTLVNGRTLTSALVKNADVLLVRSVTKVTEELLAGSAVKFVGSATIGVDHIDLPYLAKASIAFTSAPGCNAEAVADYVFSGLSHLYMTKKQSWLTKKIGIVGYGNVGKTVYQRFAGLGCDVCVYDPFKEMEQSDPNRNAIDDNVRFVGLDDVLACGVICLHAPLTASGDYPTQNMISEQALALIAPGTIIVSAGRGGIIDEPALIERHRQLNGNLHLVMDVWKGEPSINKDLLHIADIATPHIAGYSKQGREKGTLMVYQGLCQYLSKLNSGLSLDKEAVLGETFLSKGWLSHINIQNYGCFEEVLARGIQAVYDVARDDARLRFKYRENTADSTFDWLRKHYVERDEFNTCTVSTDDIKADRLFEAVSFSTDSLHDSLVNHKK
ncbi:4-phosphoerythronate dehydrogenase [Marinomonas algarum]|uniref:Erythronate-4-phosphate dehydrogenase n=1 Tax=Marinomonas algarum TaxID=2883105 RepID=A0A9X1LDX1_9GAMM|nr:4-phosphoerythronate dehydrogenase [Marinomonas algarum]MCB5160376.1 4-phosphoerythronate dehydrogenase [Marinomonas algarum]